MTNEAELIGQIQELDRLLVEANNRCDMTIEELTKENRTCAIDAGLIATAKSAVKVIRAVCDEKKLDLATCKSVLEKARGVLDELSRLGNGKHFGNSIGNEIAKDALTAIDAALSKEGRVG